MSFVKVAEIFTKMVRDSTKSTTSLPSNLKDGQLREKEKSRCVCVCGQDQCEMLRRRCEGDCEKRSPKAREEEDIEDTEKV